MNMAITIRMDADGEAIEKDKRFQLNLLFSISVLKLI